MDFSRSDFPAGFTFGAATSAYQIEGHAFGGAGRTHWDSFAATPGNVLRAEDGGRACDHYHRYEADLDLLQAAGLDAYRFSTSWARVLPEGRGAPNPEGLDFYDRLVDACLARGLMPYLTLYHWEMPSALADLGGWTNPDVAHWMADYSDVILDRIGDRVEAVATINEPWCVAYLSHFLGHHAPGHRDIRATARAMHHVLTAHAATLERMRARGQKNLGIVLNFTDIVPADTDPATVRATATEDAIFNRWFIEAITKGTYPAEALEGFLPHMPKGWEADLTRIQAPLDWLGVNYYTRQLVADAPGAPWPGTREVPGHKATTQMGWEIHPEGLRKILVRLARDHVGALPLYVTENGMSWNDSVVDGAVPDPERTAFVSDHVRAARAALSEGANVRGFFYWSLLDNYEWAFGYERRFGMVHVDFDTLERTPKASYHALAAALAR